ncbi:MAG: type I glutamate--ammonia ligase [Candidatus Gracilibacteria bacterium]
MIMELVEEYGVQFVDMQFTDMDGVLKAVTLPVHKLEDALDNNVWFDGSSISGFTAITESDMMLKPDLDTFSILPWTVGNEDPTARLICDVLNPDGSPFEGDPRFILRKQMEEAAKLGLKPFMGPELEFFLFELDAEGNPTLTPHDSAGYFDQYSDKALALRREMSFALDMMGIEIERMHHEVAAGQSEINFKYSDSLHTADNALTFKFTLKALAKKHGLHASFMPKPIFGINGSGMHVHQSLSSITDGANQFYDEKGKYGLSALAQSYIAGQLQHIRAMNAVMNPIVNSYKRLVVGYEAPVNAAWGQRNRSALIRVPRVSPAVASKGARIELRCPDPASNPYLAFAVMLAAGLDGIKKGLVAPAPVEENIWELDSKQMKKMGISTVAGTLKEALDALEKDEVIRAALGESTFEKFHASKTAEWESFRTSVSQWETDRYLDC